MVDYIVKRKTNLHTATFNNISTSDSIETVVDKCIAEFYTEDIVKLIPEDMHKMLGLAKAK